MSSGRWICKSCGWVNTCSEINRYKRVKQFHKCDNCSTERRAGRPKNVAVIVEKSKLAQSNNRNWTCEKSYNGKYIKYVRTWPDGTAW